MLGSVILAINALQRTLQQDVGGAIRDMGTSPRATLAAVGLALGLGLVHALTPGHGKAIVFSYFLGQRATLATGLRMATKIAFVHSASATVLVLVAGAAAASFGRPAGSAALLQTLSYAAVTLIGVVYLWRAFAEGEGAPHADAHRARAHAILPIAVGLLPCPLTMAIVSFAVVQTSVWHGLALAVLVAIGSAATIGAVGALGIGLRSGLLRRLDPGGRHYRLALHGLEIGSSVAIVLLGALLFMASLSLTM